MSEKPKRVATYSRVSTDLQTVANQAPVLKEYAERRGWVIANEYQDSGISGAVRSRPDLDRLISDARRRAFDIVLVAAFDRFARSTVHLLTALEEFQALGIEFVSLRESVDTTTPIGRMIFTICAAISSFERDLIRARVHAGLRRARSQGRRIGRPPAIISELEVLHLHQKGLSLREIGRKVGVSRMKVQSVLRARASAVPTNALPAPVVGPSLAK